MSDRLEAMTYFQALFIGVVLAVLYYYFLYSSQNVDAVLFELDQNIVEANRGVSEKDRLIKEKGLIEAEILKNTSNYTKSKQIITQNFTQSKALEVLTNTSRDLGMSIEGLGNFSSWDPEKSLEVATITINLEGSYEQALFLLSDLTRREDFYTIQKIMMTKSQADESGSNIKINIEFKVLRGSKASTSKTDELNAKNQNVGY